MLMLKNSKTTEKKLVLGDYMTVHVSGLKASHVYNAKPGDMQVHREELLQRIQKEREEPVQQVQKPEGDVIDVRLRVAGAEKIGWVHYSDAMNEDDKVVA